MEGNIQKKVKTSKKVSMRIDYTILLIVLTLVIVGLLMIFSASSVQANYEHQDSMRFLRSQLQFAVIGCIIMFIASNVNYKLYEKFALPIYLFNIILLALTLSPLGVNINEAQRWLNIGFSFQTSEFSKFASIVMTAFLINYYKKAIHKFKTVCIIMLPLILTCVLIIKQPSFSASVTIATVSIVMIFIGGMSMSSLIFIISSAAVAGYGLIMGASYRANRIMSFKDPFEDLAGRDWQISNSIYAIASGGMFGMGFGKSMQKYFYISQPQNDFIFAVIAEELGFIRSVALIFAYVFLIFRIFKLFVNTKDTFGRMLVAGIGLQLGIQTLMNIGVAISILPNTGVGLPFISYGGTSIIMFLAMTGVLLNVSKYRIVNSKKEVVR